MEYKTMLISGHTANLTTAKAPIAADAYTAI